MLKIYYAFFYLLQVGQKCGNGNWPLNKPNTVQVSDTTMLNKRFTACYQKTITYFSSFYIITLLLQPIKKR